MRTLLVRLLVCVSCLGEGQGLLGAEGAATGLYYNRFRYYDPLAGIYLSQDPIGLEGGLGLHNYVHDPNGWIDVFGLAGKGGTYKITFKNGKKYIGKGTEKRMNDSIKQRQKEAGSEVLVKTQVDTYGNNELGKMVEYKTMVDAGFTRESIPNDYLNNILTGETAWNANPHLQDEATKLSKKLQKSHNKAIAKANKAGCKGTKNKKV